MSRKIWKFCSVTRAQSTLYRYIKNMIDVNLSSERTIKSIQAI